MNERQLKDAADEAMADIQDRREALDDRENQISGRVEELEQQITELQRANADLAYKVERWNEIEKQGVDALTDALADIQRVLDSYKDSPGKW